MSLIGCPSCRRLVRSKETACPFCGVDLARARMKKLGMKLAVGVGAGAAALFGGIGCAYGCPDCYPPDASNKDANVMDATFDVTSDAPSDAKADVIDGGLDAKSDATDASNDAPSDAQLDADAD